MKFKYEVDDILKMNLSSLEYEEIQKAGPELLNIHRHTWRLYLNGGAMPLHQLRRLFVEVRNRYGVNLESKLLFEGLEE